MLLNAAQVAVLEWVSQGCPAGVFSGFEHRISAAALRSRGLVRTTGRGASWQAEITPAGKAVLAQQHDDVEERERPAAAGSSAAVPPEKSEGLPHHSVMHEDVKAAPNRPLSKTEQLVADLVAAGGVLRVPYWRNEGEPDYQQRVRSAQRFGKVPAGKRLSTDLVKGELEIRLEDAPAGTNLELAPVPVPARAGRLHPVAVRFRELTERHEVSRALLPRCVRIVHGLVTEAERRGYKAAIAGTRDPGRGRDDWSPGHDGHLTITIRDHRYRLRVAEEKVKLRGPVERHAKYLASLPYAYHGSRTGRYDADGTGRLTISVESGYSREGRPASWADRKSWTLEEKLPDLLRELEVRAAEDDERQLKEQQAADERQRRWELAMERARELFIEAHRADSLRAQVASWQEAKAVAEYVTALEATHGESPETREWIDWIHSYMERIDPLRSPPGLPEQVEISPEDLKPFLGGLSPYGPPQRW